MNSLPLYRSKFLVKKQKVDTLMQKSVFSCKILDEDFLTRLLKWFMRLNSHIARTSLVAQDFFSRALGGLFAHMRHLGDGTRGFYGNCDCYPQPS